MAPILLSDMHLHCVFVYCHCHDQGAVAIITHPEWLDIITAAHQDNYNKNYYEKIFKYVITMCDSELSDCAYSWRVCGKLEYNPLDKLLIGLESIQTNFDKEGGGWKFDYFKKELYTLQGHIEDFMLPYIVREYLSYYDVSNLVIHEP